MSEETNSSPQTGSSQANDESQKESRDGNDVTQAEIQAQLKKAYEIKVEGEGSEPESPTMEDIESQAEIDLGEALRRLEEAEDMVRRHQEDMLRLQAEMQNLRRRTELDVEKAHKYGQERFATELLSVIDNLERSLEAARPDESDPQAGAGVELGKLKAIREGVDLTLKSFQDCFRKFSIETIDPLGEPFDPQRHEAMATVENDKVEPNTVTAVMQKGYALHGRVIRPAMVMVSK
ncbi:MAG: nucleotide exchange factor GrpE [Gammaproteobacteria bacterium]|jgi:molecular chaperone GrpE